MNIGRRDREIVGDEQEVTVQRQARAERILDRGNLPAAILSAPK